MGDYFTTHPNDDSRSGMWLGPTSRAIQEGTDLCDIIVKVLFTVSEERDVWAGRTNIRHVKWELKCRLITKTRLNCSHIDSALDLKHSSSIIARSRRKGIPPVHCVRFTEKKRCYVTTIESDAPTIVTHLQARSCNAAYKTDLHKNISSGTRGGLSWRKEDQFVEYMN